MSASEIHFINIKYELFVELVLTVIILHNALQCVYKLIANYFLYWGCYYKNR